MLSLELLSVGVAFAPLPKGDGQLCSCEGFWPDPAFEGWGVRSTPPPRPPASPHYNSQEEAGMGEGGGAALADT